MPLSKTKAWLEKVLATDALTGDELERLVSECVTERQHLDFKSGKELKKTEPAATLREYAAAFANSDGGMIVLSYDHGQKLFDGVKPFGKTSPHDWAARVLSGMAPGFSPPPRIFETDVDGNTILVVAVQRAPRAILVPLDGDLVYFIRIGDSNYKAPQYLVSDLLLGRRSAPIFRLTLMNASFGPLQAFEPWVEDAHAGLLRIEMELENAGLMSADDVRVGIVMWGAWVRASETPPLPPPSLQAYMDQGGWEDDVTHATQAPWMLAHMKTSVDGRQLRPFDTVTVAVKPFIPVFVDKWGDNVLPVIDPTRPPDATEALTMAKEAAARRGWIHLQAAVYLIARDSEPEFHQLEIVYGGGATVKRISLAPPALRPMVAAHYVRIGEQF